MRSALLLATAAALGGCGESAPAPAAPAAGAAVRRLDVEPAGAREPGILSVVAEYEPPSSGRPDWKIRAAAAEIVERRSFRVLELRSDEPMAVSIPLDVDPQSFEQVGVTVRVTHPYVVAVRPGTADENGPATDAVHVPPRVEPVRLYFDLVGLDRDDLSRHLTIDFRRAAGFEGSDELDTAVGLLSVALIHRPLDRWLPSPADGAGPVTLGDETRIGVGLVGGSPVRVAFDAGSWRELSFAHGVPAASRGPGREHRLRVTLADERGETREQRLPSRNRWTLERLPLEGLEGRVTARFEAEVEGTDRALLALGEVRLARAARSAPSVLLITSDTHRADHLGAAESGVDVKTPALDRLARRGVLFTDCVSSSNVTLPSHAALMTGHPPRDTGVVNNADVLSEEPFTLAERFRDAGWVTYAAVSASSLRARSGLGQGFDRLSSPGLGLRDSAETVASLLGWMDDAGGLPLFVWVHLFDAHTPYREHRAYARMYYPESRDPRDPSLPELAPWQRSHGVRGVRDLDYPVALYRAEVTYLDAQLERLLHHDRLKRGITAFTADHGESLTAHHVWFRHDQLYPQTLRIPLILAWPGGPRGERVERPVRQIDVGATLLELAGIEASFPGRSLVDGSARTAASAPRFALSAGALSASVVTGPWFFVLHLREHQPPDLSRPRILAHSLELYDLSRDPDCERELSAQQPEEARKLRQLVIDWLMNARPSGWNAPRDFAGAAAMKELAELGYATDMRGTTRNAWFDPDCECERCRRWE